MYKIIIYFFFIILLSCSSQVNKVKKKTEDLRPPDVLYTMALKEYKNGFLQNSVEILKKIEVNYSYTTFGPKAYLMTAYIYYESNDYVKALEYLKRFKEFFPASKNFVYAEFLTAICLYEQINDVARDQTPTLLALKQFNNIIKNYPKSIYAEEARIRIDLANEQIASHEMYLARFYISKQKWTSAILRLQTVIEKYQRTIFVDEALHRMVEINYRIGNLDTAKKYAAILGYNYNESDWYRKSYAIVGDKNYKKLNDISKKSFKNKLLSVFSLSKDD